VGHWHQQWSLTLFLASKIVDFLSQGFSISKSLEYLLIIVKKSISVVQVWLRVGLETLERGAVILLFGKICFLLDDTPAGLAGEVGARS
jgi:hypothetical protein